ncbi:hypothetical protein [Ensifer sp. ENS08]|uniref:hypothetical protein n=1 Tax=Ensifer sp. ENS08 TaxID=2769273 RepID=UPI001782E49C|nr:hypothetical protein [Ensifer sp. ENS08]MBD9571737.1 hypothetical protein [Ensifer sp. ENS08]
MTSLLVEDLIRAADNCERARWLLTVPASVLYRDQLSIRSLLVRANLREGLTYLATEIAALCAVREPDGTLKPEITQSREIARTELLALVGEPATMEAANVSK